MPYNRRYTPNQVHDILCASDRRPRPGTLIGNAPLGHPISQHGDSRSNILDKRNQSVIPLHETLAETRSAVPQPPLPAVRPSRAVEDDSRFLSRMDMIRGVCHALNSPEGQRELSKLATQPRAEIEVPLDRGLNIQSETSRHPIVKSGSGKSKTVEEAQGPSFYKKGIALGIFVLVYRVEPPTPACEIHVHTAYPTVVG